MDYWIIYINNKKESKSDKLEKKESNNKESKSDKLEEKELSIVNIDPINKGPYILESLKIDKNLDKNDALNDIYKVLRPGEAPSTEITKAFTKWS